MSKRTVVIWELKDLIKHASETSTEIEGKWVPARPVNYKYRTIVEKLKDSFAVFIGKAEAFKWPMGQ